MTEGKMSGAVLTAVCLAAFAGAACGGTSAVAVHADAGVITDSAFDKADGRHGPEDLPDVVVKRTYGDSPRVIPC